MESYMLISEICKRLKIIIPALKKAMKEAGLVETITISRGVRRVNGIWIPHEKVADIPTQKAHDMNICKWPRSSWGRGAKGSHVWDFYMVCRVCKLMEK